MYHIITRLTLVMLGTIALGACAGTPSTSDPDPGTEARGHGNAAADEREKTEASGADGTQEAEAALDAVLDEVWDLQMRTYPTWATYEGDRRFDDQLADRSPEARAAYLDALETLAERAEAIDPDSLSPASRDTRAMLLLDAENKRAVEACRTAEWAVDGLGGPQKDYPMLAVFHPIDGQEDVDNLHARYLATEQHMATHIANLRRGLADGLVSTETNIQRAIDQIDRTLATPLDDDPMLQLDVREGASAFDDAKLRAAVEETVRPALERYRTFLVEEVRPEARPDQGIADLPVGEECYAARLRATIGDGYTPEALHELGKRELARAHAGMVETGAALGLPHDTAADVMAAVEAHPDAFASSEEQLLTLNEEAVARAWTVLPDAFGRVPDAPIDVKPMEAHRAPDAPAAFYYAAAGDGSRDAIYYVNTHLPTTRPLYNLEALAFHEAVPGHHLQIAIAQSLPELHIWRRNAGQTAFSEGWALYAEVLADELGLYSTPLTRFGMYNYQAWRAVRLVVDTGLHHQGWSRDEALAFFVENTLFPRQEAANEIDRYIAWPAQALAYMTGRLEIERLRARAESELGDAFDLREFHDVVLGSGSVPLTILEAHVEAWIASKSRRDSASRASNTD